MSHVVSTLSTDVGPVQEQVRESVQTKACGEGADEAVKTSQGDAKRPANAQQHHQPYDAPET